ncbi:uncharacterized protein L3040_002904 [Drepanopeziza brunnea f. sp. 'multigermtubi']|uniref:uncharacterized protein n=1 Tax=Drepanopeziza brunnea f. sp. 'multigermtubi' TaxID=698441 RepID=UPI0023869CBB|nr:hypothetical protein L3040_002904 [Drepanopeziza brunnea f. sp. 'multigermtubi']
MEGSNDNHNNTAAGISNHPYFHIGYACVLLLAVSAAMTWGTPPYLSSLIVLIMVTGYATFVPSPRRYEGLASDSGRTLLPIFEPSKGYGGTTIAGLRRPSCNRRLGSSETLPGTMSETQSEEVLSSGTLSGTLWGTLSGKLSGERSSETLSGELSGKRSSETLSSGTLSETLWETLSRKLSGKRSSETLFSETLSEANPDVPSSEVCQADMLLWKSWVKELDAKRETQSAADPDPYSGSSEVCQAEMLDPYARSREVCHVQMGVCQALKKDLEAERETLRRTAQECYRRHASAAGTFAFGPEHSTQKSGYGWLQNEGPAWWAADRALQEKTEEIREVERKMRALKEEIEALFWKSCG